MKLLIFSLLLCLGASLKGQDANGRTNVGFQSADAPNFTINEIGPPNFILVDDCKPMQTIKTVSGLVLASCVEGKWVAGHIVVTSWKTFPPRLAKGNYPDGQGAEENPCDMKHDRIGTLGGFDFRNCEGYQVSKPPAVDVPAIQETVKTGQCEQQEPKPAPHCKGLSCLLVECKPMTAKVWTCRDPHNYALLTSVDGEIHTCHRISQ